MIGMDATTGKPLGGTAHLAQSVGDILTTPIGSRVMRRDYGSLLFDLIDQPLNSATRLLLAAATAIALRRWEPRLQLTRVTFAGEPQAGSLAVTVTGRRTDGPQANSRISLSIPIRPIVSASS